MTFTQLTVLEDLNSHCIFILTHSHFVNPPLDGPHPRFISHTSRYWHIIKNI